MPVTMVPSIWPSKTRQPFRKIATPSHPYQTGAVKHPGPSVAWGVAMLRTGLPIIMVCGTFLHLKLTRKTSYHLKTYTAGLPESSAFLKICRTPYKSEFGKLLPHMQGWCLYSVSSAHVPFASCIEWNTCAGKEFFLPR